MISNKKIKGNKGFTLIEALIAVLILAVVSVMTVQGVKMSRTAYSSNYLKTQATALANQEIEKIRAMPYKDIGIKNGNPAGLIDSQKTINSFTVNYSISWTESSKRTKQIKVAVFKSPMVNSVEVFAEITPLGEIIASENAATTSTTSAPTTTALATTTTVAATTTTVAATTTTVAATTTTVSATTTTVPATTTTIDYSQYPPPTALEIMMDKLTSGTRSVKIKWLKPVTKLTVLYYKIYRNNIFIDTCSSFNLKPEYTDTTLQKGDSSTYQYKVTAYYATVLVESLPSNIITTKPQ